MLEEEESEGKKRVRNGNRREGKEKKKKRKEPQAEACSDTCKKPAWEQKPAHRESYSQGAIPVFQPWEGAPCQ